MSDSELNHIALPFKLEHADRITLCAKLRPEFISPTKHEPSRLVDFDHFATIAHTAIGDHQLPGRTFLPGGVMPRVAPVRACEFRLYQRVPELFDRGTDVGDINEFAVSHFPSFLIVLLSFPSLPAVSSGHGVREGARVHISQS